MHCTLFFLQCGAAVSVISHENQQKLFPEAIIKETAIKLRTCTGEAINIIGEMDVHVNYNMKESNLALTVVAGKGPTLLGRDWLRNLNLDWKTIGLTSLDIGQVQIEALIKKYAAVFKEGLGTMNDFKAILAVQPDANSKFHKPRSIPFAIREIVGKELDRLEQEGVLKRVNFSEWASPIVAVPKKDGQFRVCEDYKATINPSLEVDQYPLPNPEELFVSLTVGRVHCSRLD